MRKRLIIIPILLFLLFRIAGIAFAAKVADAEIPVIIEGGGTAYMIPEVNCPLPKESTIKVGNGRTGYFYITFTEAGEYHYLIKAGFTEEGGEREANEVFRLTVTVNERSDGELFTISVINGGSATEKQDKVRFQKTPERTTQPSAPPVTTETPSGPGTPGKPETPDTPSTGKPFGTPKTGDESHLNYYVLIATAASAGLFLLALVYTLNTNKLIKEE